jgi:hypothetical protein
MTVSQIFCCSDLFSFQKNLKKSKIPLPATGEFDIIGAVRFAGSLLHPGNSSISGSGTNLRRFLEQDEHSEFSFTPLGASGRFRRFS